MNIQFTKIKIQEIEYQKAGTAVIDQSGIYINFHDDPKLDIYISHATSVMIFFKK